MTKRVHIIRIWIFVVILFFLLTAYWYVLAPYGPGVTPDSVCYGAMARSIAREGIPMVNGQVPVHWPPGYPAIIGLLMHGTSIMDPVRIVAWLNLFLWLASGGLFYWLLRRLAFDRNVAVLYAVGFILSQGIWPLYRMMWTEPLFMTVLLVVLLLWSVYRDKGDILYLALVGLLLGLLFWIRYAALGIIGGFGLILLIDLLKGRISFKALIAWLLPLIFLIVIWWQWYRKSAIGSSVRHLGWHPPGLSHYLWGIKSVLIWWIPCKTNPWFWICTIGLGGILVYAIYKRWKSFSATSPALSFSLPVFWYDGLILSGTYVLFIWLTATFFDPLLDFNGRILSPLFPLFYAGLLWGLDKYAHLRQIAIIVALVVAIGGMVSARNYYLHGAGFTGKSYKQSEIFTNRLLKKFHGRIITNAPEYLFFRYGRIEPGMNCFTSTIQDTLYPSAYLCREIARGGALILYFDAVKRKRFVDRDSLWHAFPPGYRRKFPGGWLLGKPERIKDLLNNHFSSKSLK